jgi:hypothetical protein
LFSQFYLELSGPYIRMNSLQHEYEQDIRASIFKESATRKEAISNVGCAPESNAISNPTYMMVQSTSKVANDYVNVLQDDNQVLASLNVGQQDGYLKMSPIMPKQVRTTQASDESNVYL